MHELLRSERLSLVAATEHSHWPRYYSSQRLMRNSCASLFLSLSLTHTLSLSLSPVFHVVGTTITFGRYRFTADKTVSSITIYNDYMIVTVVYCGWLTTHRSDKSPVTNKGTSKGPRWNWAALLKKLSRSCRRMYRGGDGRPLDGCIWVVFIEKIFGFMRRRIMDE